VDLDRPIRADLLLTTLPGAAPFLREDLRGLPGVTVGGGGNDHVLVTLDGTFRPLLGLQSYSTLGLVLGREVVAALAGWADGLAALFRGRDLRFRVGAELPDRAELIERISAELGWRNRPSDWDVNLTAVGGTGVGGTVVAQLGAMFLTARLGELARMPASTTPIIADIMVRLARVRPGHTVLDPCCGAGTLLVTAARRAAATGGGPALRLVGCDLDRAALAAARDNAARRAVPMLLVRADAAALPVADGRVDRLVSNLPFGKRVGSHRGNTALYPAFLRSAERVLTADGRIVLLTEDKALLRDTVQRTRGLKITREVLFRSGGATPTAYVIGRSRRPRTR
jgi:predicted RNA methylase